MKQEPVRGVPLHMPGAGGALKNRMGGFILVGVRFGLPAVTRRGVVWRVWGCGPG